jgi:hypothetical protein
MSRYQHPAAPRQHFKHTHTQGPSAALSHHYTHLCWWVEGQVVWAVASKEVQHARQQQLVGGSLLDEHALMVRRGGAQAAGTLGTLTNVQ